MLVKRFIKVEGKIVITQIWEKKEKEEQKYFKYQK